MSTIRPYDPSTDYQTLVKWWTAHKATVLPPYMLPAGWIIEAGAVEIAACFLFMDTGGTWAVLEFLTTNPSVSLSRFLVEDVRKLIAFIEDQARERKCVFIGSFVAPNTGEERMMQRIGYTDAGGPPHKLYCKPLGPKGGA